MLSLKFSVSSPLLSNFQNYFLLFYVMYLFYVCVCVRGDIEKSQLLANIFYILSPPPHTIFTITFQLIFL